jgi:archaemetzincin
MPDLLERLQEALADRYAVERELGHTFGLVHCDDYRCVMHASTYVEDVDVKGASFCPSCRGAIE